MPGSGPASSVRCASSAPSTIPGSTTSTSLLASCWWTQPRLSGGGASALPPKVPDEQISHESCINPAGGVRGYIRARGPGNIVANGLLEEITMAGNQAFLANGKRRRVTRARADVTHSYRRTVVPVHRARAATGTRLKVGSAAEFREFHHALGHQPERHQHQTSRMEGCRPDRVISCPPEVTRRVVVQVTCGWAKAGDIAADCSVIGADHDRSA